MKDKLVAYTDDLRTNAAVCVAAAMNAIDAQRCCNWIRHCEVYTEGNIIERVVFLVMYTENFYYMCCTRDLNQYTKKKRKKSLFIVYK